MLRIGICDDNREDIARIRELAVRFSEEHPETPVQIQAYGQPYDLLDEVEKSGGFDLYLLDVVMPHMTGVALARRLRERKERAEILFLTNASGAVNYDFHVGDFMMITDQVSNFVPSPLIGPNIEELGERFCDMSQIYNHDLCRILRETAEELGVHLQEGTYIQLTGPNYETPKEVKMCRILGADAVGMSTACEAVAANHMGMKICGISCISNMGCGMSEQPLSHEEVKETADRVAPLFKKLITASITRMGRM